MLTAEEMEPAGHVHVNAGRLWAGGVATAIINIVVGVAVISLLSGVGRVAIRPAALPTIPDRPVTSR
jgi:hypothetical protein